MLVSVGHDTENDVSPPIPHPLEYPCLFSKDAERKLPCTYQNDVSRIDSFFSYIGVDSNPVPISMSNTKFNRD